MSRPECGPCRRLNIHVIRRLQAAPPKQVPCLVLDTQKLLLVNIRSEYVGLNTKQIGLL